MYQVQVLLLPLTSYVTSCLASTSLLSFISKVDNTRPHTVVEMIEWSQLCKAPSRMLDTTYSKMVMVMAEDSNKFWHLFYNFCKRSLSCLNSKELSIDIHSVTDKLAPNAALGSGSFQIHLQSREESSLRMAPFWQKLDAGSLYLFKEGTTVFRYVTKDMAIKTNHLQFLDSLIIGSVIFLLWHKCT